MGISLGSFEHSVQTSDFVGGSGQAHRLGDKAWQGIKIWGQSFKVLGGVEAGLRLRVQRVWWEWTLTGIALKNVQVCSITDVTQGLGSIPGVGVGTSKRGQIKEGKRVKMSGCKHSQSSHIAIIEELTTIFSDEKPSVSAGKKRKAPAQASKEEAVKKGKHCCSKC